MLGLNVVRCVLTVQIVGLAENGEVRLCQITLGGKVKIHIVRLEPKLSAGGKDLLIGLQLAGVGQAALVVAGLLPRIAEIYINAVRFLLRGKMRIQLLNVLGQQRHVFHRLLTEFSFNVAACHAENVHADVHADEVHILFPVCKGGEERTLAAAQIQMQGLVFFKKGFPGAGSLFRLVYIERAGGKLRSRPLFLSDSQGGSSLLLQFALYILPQFQGFRNPCALFSGCLPAEKETPKVAAKRTDPAAVVPKIHPQAAAKEEPATASSEARAGSFIPVS